MRLSFVFVLFSLSLFAASTPPPSMGSALDFKLSYSHKLMGYASFEGDHGEVAYSQDRVEVGNALFGYSYTRWNFSWKDMQNSDFSQGNPQPLEHLHNHSLTMKLPHVTDDGRMLMGMVMLNSVYEKESSDSYGATVLGYSTLKTDGEGMGTLGFIVFYHPVRTLIYPMGSYAYRMRAKEGWKASIGFPMTYVGYQVSDSLMWMATMSFNAATTRLRDDSTIAPEGYLSLTDYLGGFGFRYFMGDDLTVNATLTSTLYRNVQVFDHDGERTGRYTLNPSYGAQIGLQYRF